MFTVTNVLLPGGNRPLRLLALIPGAPAGAFDLPRLLPRLVASATCKDKAALTEGTVYIHPTADVSDKAEIGEGTRIWHQAQVREGVSIGKRCVVGKGAYVDRDVRIGDFCKLQNGVSVFHGFNLESGVFLGPGVMLLNDKHPRAINSDGSPKTDTDWMASSGLIEYGASIGGGAVVLPGVRVGRMALVGSGAVITRDVPERGIVVGNPARLRGYACDCGNTLTRSGPASRRARFGCSECGRDYEIEVESMPKRPSPASS
jgi:UDP-2-acetamido-3-amino-2,3-dideoxy-glucuronate N-acetyltransferase